MRINQFFFNLIEISQNVVLLKRVTLPPLYTSPFSIDSNDVLTNFIRIYITE